SGRIGVASDVDGPFVATLVPGVRGTADAVPGKAPQLHDLALPGMPGQAAPGAARPGTAATPGAGAAPGAGAPPDVPDCRTVEVLPPDPATADLAEAPRILAA